MVWSILTEWSVSAHPSNYRHCSPVGPKSQTWPWYTASYPQGRPLTGQSNLTVEPAARAEENGACSPGGVRTHNHTVHSQCGPAGAS